MRQPQSEQVQDLVRRHGVLRPRAVRFSGPVRVLLNITMPGMDGYAVGRHLKFDFRTRRTPLIHVHAGA